MIGHKAMIAPVFQTLEPPPIAAGLFVDEVLDEARARLRGGEERNGGRIVFPCPVAQADRFVPVALSREGTLWSFTVQRFRPKTPPYAGPETFEPYAVGYVELPGEVIVESRLIGIPFDALHIGMPLRLTTEIVTVAGQPRTSYAFTRREG